ncbi:MAG: type II toxin-antitoxin system Phd/YefM family antitoxin [Magnetococcales bacterium]|nr:type II toxin-antitoxin system Phd/YefM family antitoxin [Magnetococcales bacterium]
MTRYSIREAKKHLSRLIHQSLSGEEVIIARGEKPLVKLIPLASISKERVFGSLKGTGYVDDCFSAPLPAEVLATWEGK